MKIALTGTPGTGKTTVSELLDRPVIDLKEYMRENGIGEQREELEVDIEELKQKFSTDLEDVVVEGHLSHHLDVDICVVLRCHPEELESRLEARDYSQAKVEENLHAEALDVILQEAADEGHKIIEVDTTGRTPEEVAEEVRERVEERDTGYGELDFTPYLS
jgi:adenylate kinase